MRHITLTVEESDAGERLDRLMARKLEGISRSAAEKLIEGENVWIGQKNRDKSFRCASGDTVEILMPDPVPLEVIPQPIPLDIPYEDEDLLVVNKPKGMVVHPAPGHADGTLVNALLAHCGDSLSGINGVLRPGIVHRIDKDTSGLLIVAKNDFAHRNLAAQIKDHSFTRIYEAVVTGNLKEDNGTVDAPIGRHPVKRKKMAITEKHSRRAVTHYQVITRYRGFTHVRLKLETGRTHQIRVHMAYIGHPVAGDPVYGSRKPIRGFQGQCLHARVIGFHHPRDGRYLEFTSDLPPYFTNFLKRLSPL